MTEEEREREHLSRQVEDIEKKMAEGWDGTERREGAVASDALGTRVVEAMQSTNVAQPHFGWVWGVVTLGAIIALQVLILVSQFRLADAQAAAANKQTRFRDALSCYVVELARIPYGTVPDSGVLTKCGFINVPGND